MRRLGFYLTSLRTRFIVPKWQWDMFSSQHVGISLSLAVSLMQPLAFRCDFLHVKAGKNFSKIKNISRFYYNE